MTEESPTDPVDKHESLSGASVRSERRRSLPLRTSYTSLNSQYALGDAQRETNQFELRRRRAAKLSQFFGVGYRDLFGEVLDSIEISVREDEGKGTLNAAEAEVCFRLFLSPSQTYPFSFIKDLLVQLSRLRARRNEIS
jgi:hypothetical protein